MLAEELKPGLKGIEIGVKVASKESEGQAMVKDGSMHKVAEFLVGDESASILLSLWDESIEKVEVGKTYCIEKAYTAMFKHSIRLNVGKFGKIFESSEAIGKVNTENNLSERELGNEKI